MERCALHQYRWRGFIGLSAIVEQNDREIAFVHSLRNMCRDIGGDAFGQSDSMRMRKVDPSQ